MSDHWLHCRTFLALSVLLGKCVETTVDSVT